MMTNETLLKCTVCGSPFSIITYEDSIIENEKEKKSLGCTNCSSFPIITHNDLNVIFNTFFRLKKEGKI